MFKLISQFTTNMTNQVTTSSTNTNEPQDNEIFRHIELSKAQRLSCFEYIEARAPMALAFATTDHIVDWKNKGRKHRVDLYEASVDSIHDTRGVCRINACIEDVMHFLICRNDQAYQHQQRIVLGKDRYHHAKHLTKLLPHEENPGQPYHYASLKWHGVDSTTTKLGRRDLVLVDFSDISMDPTNENRQMGYHVFESIRIPECPSLYASHSLIRASIRCGAYVVKETSTPGMVELTLAVHIDSKHAPLSERAQRHDLEQIALQVGAIRDYIENKKIASMKLVDKSKWVADEYRKSCNICLLPFQMLWRSRHHCRCCGEVICHKCHTKNPVLVQDTEGVTEEEHKFVRVRICKKCILQTRMQPPKIRNVKLDEMQNERRNLAIAATFCP